MAHAYTPGLKVSGGVILEKIRRLPLPGDILVKTGDLVTAETIIARTELPGQVSSANIAGILGIQPEDIDQYMLKVEGQSVERDEVVASTKGIFGLFKSQFCSPVNGSIESVSKVTGQVMLREPEIPVEINAYVDGQVVDVMHNEGVVVQTYGMFMSDGGSIALTGATDQHTEAKYCDHDTYEWCDEDSDRLLHEHDIDFIHISDFEVLDNGGALYDYSGDCTLYYAYDSDIRQVVEN